MIVISAGLNQAEIRGHLQRYNGTDFRFKFVRKHGIKLFFEVAGTSNLERAAKRAKAIIKETDWGKRMSFSSMPVGV